MVHNRTMGFPCNFGWWRQQQTAFFQVKTSNFPLRKFQVASHNTEEVRLSISPMIDQMNFSREFNTLYMASSSTGEIPNFVSASLAILYVSICFPVRVYQLKREYLFHALKPANWKHRPVGTFCKQARRRIPASFTIPASRSLLYCPISQSGLTSFI